MFSACHTSLRTLGWFIDPTWKAICLSMWAEKAMVPGVHWLSRLAESASLGPNKTRKSERDPVSENNVDSLWGMTPRFTSGLSTHIHTHPCGYMCPYTYIHISQIIPVTSHHSGSRLTCIALLAARWGTYWHSNPHDLLHSNGLNQ